jgi:hypothetical protein
MPSVEHVRGDIALLLDALERKRLLAAAPNYPVRRSIGAWEEVSWERAPKEGLRERYGQFATPAEYRMLLENRQYTAVLRDGGMLMMYYRFAVSGRLVAHNLCYYPCPLDVDWDPDTEEPEPFVDAFDALLARELSCALLEQDIYVDTCESRLLMRAPLRFDYAPEQARDDHSACHVHVAHPDCRIPVFGPVSVGHFVRFVFGNYYRDWLDECGDFAEIPNRFYGRELVDAHRGVLHLDWLTDDERRRLALSD